MRTTADRFLARALSKRRKHETVQGNRQVLDYLRKAGVPFAMHPAA